MLIFGHIGVTVGIFILLERIVPSLRGRFAYFYIALGALLPDLLDKPIGRVIFAESIANGRLLGHTLAFCFFIALLGYYQYGKSKDIRVFLVSGACFLHLLEDRMWATPHVFFWPVFGWEFPVGSYTGNVFDYFIKMFRIGYVPSLCPCFITEFIGFIIAAFILGNYLRHRRAL
ncbi:metal-dependent hydrolase [Methanosarcina sp. KYL-1]|uniref:metal-dependent hydrolase n=1 Tax=Methanosarcina sp. KYL-1 TaxID=2602068 RepID=UPI002100D14D|nr:metal-dependent hydrolase [Methanosarcina sp. KYL-1]MCQ1535221.1 metal-dependent hydrolase [Methanosarcina sp. KYL-1]